MGRIKVGPRPVHIYAINATSKAWSHSDAEGNFYVLSGYQNNGSWIFNKKLVPVSSLIGILSGSQLYFHTPQGTKAMQYLLSFSNSPLQKLAIPRIGTVYLAL